MVRHWSILPPLALFASLRRAPFACGAKCSTPKVDDSAATPEGVNALVAANNRFGMVYQGACGQARQIINHWVESNRGAIIFAGLLVDPSA